MSEDIACFRCGASLAALSLPLSRRDMCPDCGVHLHVCRMCVQFDPSVPGQCREDDAEDVTDKDRVNYCEWFEPSPHAFDAGAKQQADRARQQLDALFAGGDDTPVADDDAASDAEKLFR